MTGWWTRDSPKTASRSADDVNVRRARTGSPRSSELKRPASLLQSVRATGNCSTGKRSSTAFAPPARTGPSTTRPLAPSPTTSKTPCGSSVETYRVKRWVSRPSKNSNGRRRRVRPFRLGLQGFRRDRGLRARDRHARQDHRSQTARADARASTSRPSARWPIYAHPDDADVAAGGLLAQWAHGTADAVHL
jgi:hypothetical protein